MTLDLPGRPRGCCVDSTGSLSAKIRAIARTAYSPSRTRAKATTSDRGGARQCNCSHSRQAAHRPETSPAPLRGRLLPLDGAGRLGGDVVDHPVHAADLVDDAGGGAGEDVPRKFEHV